LTLDIRAKNFRCIVVQWEHVLNEALILKKALTPRRHRSGRIRRDVQAEHRGRRLMDGAAWNVPTFQFSFGSYWDSHYRGRPFYRERVRWEHHWHDHDRRVDDDWRDSSN
jgi:hypothetical protein